MAFVTGFAFSSHAMRSRRSRRVASSCVGGDRPGATLLDYWLAQVLEVYEMRIRLAFCAPQRRCF